MTTGTANSQQAYEIRQELSSLDLVHERLSISHPGAGNQFVLSADFDLNPGEVPQLRVTITDEETTVSEFLNNGWSATFPTAYTPASVIRATVEAAIAAL